MFGIIVQPITNDTTPANVESYGDIVDMDTAFNEGFSRDFCDGQTSPVPPRWADDQAGMLYTYDRATAEMFRGILREDIAARVASGQLLPPVVPIWATWEVRAAVKVPSIIAGESMDPDSILPLHEVRDMEKLNILAESMKKDGWLGNPIIVIDRGDHYQAITGVHRLEAAKKAGVKPRVYVIEEPPFMGDWTVSELFEQLMKGSDIERLTAMEELYSLGKVNKIALDIMIME